MQTAQIVYSDSYLAHHGILGQKWGVRRYQNPDGSLTALGAKRYGSGSLRTAYQETAKYRSRESLINKRYSTERKNIRNDRALTKREKKNAISEARYARVKSHENNVNETYKNFSERGYNSNKARNYALGAVALIGGTVLYSRLSNSMFTSNVSAGKAMVKSIIDGALIGVGSATIGNTYMTSKYEKYGNINANKSLENRYSKKIESTKAKKDADVKSFDAITQDLKYKNGKTFYSVQDAKRDQQATADSYDKIIKDLERKRDHYSVRK